MSLSPIPLIQLCFPRSSLQTHHYVSEGVGISLQIFDSMYAPLHNIDQALLLFTIKYKGINSFHHVTERQQHHQTSPRYFQMNKKLPESNEAGAEDKVVIWYLIHALSTSAWFSTHTHIFASVFSVHLLVTKQNFFSFYCWYPEDSVFNLMPFYSLQNKHITSPQISLIILFLHAPSWCFILDVNILLTLVKQKLLTLKMNKWLLKEHCIEMNTVQSLDRVLTALLLRKY